MPKKVLWKLLVWFVLMGYLVLDLLVLKGPLHSRLKNKKQVLPDEERGIAARVFHKPIYLSQIDYAVDKKLWATGRTREGISDTERTYLRQVALRDLADQYILRTKLAGQDEEYPVSDEEISTAVKKFSNRFLNKEEMVKALKANGVQGEKELRYRMAAKIQQDRYIQKFIKVDNEVISKEAKRCYEEYKEQAKIPESVRVQHVFCAKLENAESLAMAKLTVALAALQLSYDKSRMLGEIAKFFSEDARTNQKSGDLGWIRKGRIAADFTDQVFATKVGKPKIIETKLGWHLILVNERKSAKLRSFEEMKDEIVIGLESHERRNNVEKFRITLRKQLADRIKINWEMLNRPWTELEASE